MSKYKVVNDFVEYMEKECKKTYNQTQISNFEILFEKLEGKSKIAQIIPIPMGEGKSKFIEFYCRYKYDTDKDFSAVVVKKTINECDNFCISLGLKEEYRSNTEVWGIPLECISKSEIYHGIQAINGKHKMYENFPQYKMFKAYTLKSFNFKDCIEYRDIRYNPKDEIEENLIAMEYDNRLCLNCERKCPIKTLKHHMKDFRIIAVSHDRLFWSNDTNTILDNILYYKNEKGESIKRKLLIIDEKISMFYRELLRIENFNKLKNYINNCGSGSDKELIKEYEKIIEKLDFESDKIETLENPFKIKEEFSKELLHKIIYNKENKEIEKAIAFLSKLSTFPEIHTFINNLTKYEQDSRELAVTKYIDLSTYTKYFENTIITDATSPKDLEYSKSDSVIVDTIVPTRGKINWYRPLNNCKMTKSQIKRNYKNILSAIGKECDNIIQKNSNSKTLIVTYKWVKEKNDTYIQEIEENIKSDKNLYKIIYFGQYTTGVNSLREYQNIIFLGQLRKGEFYDVCKAKIFKKNKTELSNNDFLINTVQQIGRTSYRNKITPNVYFFEQRSVVSYIEKELSYFFDVNIFKYENKFLFDKQEYNSINRNAVSHYGDFLRFVFNEYQKLSVSKKEYTLNEIKQAINYKNKDHKKAFLDKAKDFVEYDKKSKIVTIDFEKAKSEIENILKIEL